MSAPTPEKSERPFVLGLSDLHAAKHLRCLIIGGAKTGKSWLIRTLTPDMLPVLVFNSDDANALTRAAGTLDAKDFAWVEMYGNDLQITEKCIGEARKGAMAGRYKSIIWDTATCYAERSIEVHERASLTQNGNTDGRIFYRNQKKHVMNIIARLKLLPAHLFVMVHDDVQREKLQTIPGQAAKSGANIAPGFEGALRSLMPREFQDVIYLDRGPGQSRIFCLSAEGVTGPGSRTLPGVESMNADLGEFWLRAQGKYKAGGTQTVSKQVTNQIKGKVK